MKTLKISTFFCFAALLAGCFVHDSAEVSAEKTISLTDEAAMLTEKEQAETTTSLALTEEAEEEKEDLLEELFSSSDCNFREINRPKETENPTKAEQIYQTLYAFADFYEYQQSYMPLLIDQNDVLFVERIVSKETYNLNEENFGQQDFEEFYRVKYGRITTAKEYYYQLLHFVTDHYIARPHGFYESFQLSGGNLYLTEYAVSPTNMLVGSSSLTRIEETGKDRLTLVFTAELGGVSEESTVEYVIPMAYESGCWRIDEYDDSSIRLLYSEIIWGGKDGDQPKTDLPEQIERCLKESGLL